MLSVIVRLKSVFKLIKVNMQILFQMFLLNVNLKNKPKYKKGNAI